jgi:hypothetical protein
MKRAKTILTLEYWIDKNELYAKMMTGATSADPAMFVTGDFNAWELA